MIPIRLQHPALNGVDPFAAAAPSRPPDEACFRTRGSVKPPVSSTQHAAVHPVSRLQRACACLLLPLLLQLGGPSTNGFPALPCGSGPGVHQEDHAACRRLPLGEATLCCKRASYPARA